jgi:capsular polysaccharide biosynthesis protein
MNEKVIRDQVDVDFGEIITLILNKAVIIILVAICSAILCYTYEKEHQKISYTASTKMYILSRNNSMNTIGGNNELTKAILGDYKELIYSKDILEEVISKLTLSMDYNTLASQISIRDNATVVMIYVTDQNPIMAMRIANTVRDVMAEYIYKTMGVELFDLIEKAYLPNPVIQDRSIRRAVMGGIISVCLLCGFIVGRYLLDDTIKKPEDIETKLELSVLASIPIRLKRTVELNLEKEIDEEIYKEIYKYSYGEGNDIEETKNPSHLKN